LTVRCIGLVKVTPPGTAAMRPGRWSLPESIPIRKKRTAPRDDTGTITDATSSGCGPVSQVVSACSMVAGNTQPRGASRSADIASAMPAPAVQLPILKTCEKCQGFGKAIPRKRELGAITCTEHHLTMIIKQSVSSKRCQTSRVELA
jgi:hypothetical protein